MPLNDPVLSINYSPEFDLQFRLVNSEQPPNSTGDYRLQVKCFMRHPTGHFEYVADDLYFESNALADFGAELRQLQQGSSNHAALRNAGEMFVFRLELRGRTLHSALSVREYIPGDGLASLNFPTAEVDYDLFVNKLLGAVEQFEREVRESRSKSS